MGAGTRHRRRADLLFWKAPSLSLCSIHSNNLTGSTSQSLEHKPRIRGILWKAFACPMTSCADLAWQRVVSDPWKKPQASHASPCKPPFCWLRRQESVLHWNVKFQRHKYHCGEKVIACRLSCIHWYHLIAKINQSHVKSSPCTVVWGCNAVLKVRILSHAFRCSCLADSGIIHVVRSKIWTVGAHHSLVLILSYAKGRGCSRALEHPPSVRKPSVPAPAKYKQLWWCLPSIPALRNYRQGVQKVKVILSYQASLRISL